MNVEEWDKSLFTECHACLRGIAVLTDENTSVLKLDNSTVLADDNTLVLTDDNTHVITHDNSTILTGDNTLVITHDYSTILTGDNTTVITDDCALYKRKIKEIFKEKCASHPALQAKARTPFFIVSSVTSQARPPPIT